MENQLTLMRYCRLIHLFRTHLQELHYYEVSKDSDVTTLLLLKKAIKEISNEMRSIERVMCN